MKNPTATPLHLPSFPIPALHELVTRHFRSTRAPELVAGGQRPLALVYLLVATLVAEPLRQTVVVVDAEARFDVRQLLGIQPKASALGRVDIEGSDATVLAFPVTEDDLQHVHVFRADPRWHVPLSELAATAEQRVLYGAQRRRDRPCWGTIIIGGASASGSDSNKNTSRNSEDGGGSSTIGSAVGVGLVTGSYGWLRVDCLQRNAWEARQERQAQLLTLFENVNLRHENMDEEMEFEPVTWIAGSPWGAFSFQLSGPTCSLGQENKKTSLFL